MINAIDIHNVNVIQPFDNSGFINILGDAGDQGHVAPPSAKQDTTNVLGMVNMANGSKARIYQFDNTTIADENGT